MTVAESRHAALLLRTLAAAEDASVRGDDERLERLLDGFDPIEARRLADVLEDEALREEGWREARRTIDWISTDRRLRRREAVLRDVLSIPGSTRKVW